MSTLKYNDYVSTVFLLNLFPSIREVHWYVYIEIQLVDIRAGMGRPVPVAPGSMMGPPYISQETDKALGVQLITKPSGF